MTEIVVDCSLLIKYAGLPAVGIVRCEREIVREALLRGVDKFVRFDDQSSLYRIVPAYLVAELLEDQCEVTEQEAIASAFRRFNFESHMTLLIAGLAWDSFAFEYIYSQKQRKRFEVVVILYDVIPSILPEYCVPEMQGRFYRYMQNVTWCADYVFGISDATVSDYSKFVDEYFDFKPEVGRIGLGVTRGSRKTKKPILQQGFIGGGDPLAGGFVLYVSSIEPRKNHKLLFDVWRELYASHGDDLPSLVFVGKQQWNSSDLVAQIKLSELYNRGKICILEGLRDDELSYMYRNCKFTVYPSLYEGWGLPITESLMNKKPCISSNTSSMPEAGFGAVEALHPLDFIGWKRLIESYVFDDTIFSAAVRQVKTVGKIPTWKEAMRSFFDKLNKVLGSGAK